MNIYAKPKPESVAFSSLKPGDVFLWGVTPYLKKKPYVDTRGTHARDNAVCLQDGAAVSFYLEEKVHHLPNAILYPEPIE